MGSANGKLLKNCKQDRQIFENMKYYELSARWCLFIAFFRSKDKFVCYISSLFTVQFFVEIIYFHAGGEVLNPQW